MRSKLIQPSEKSHSIVKECVKMIQRKNGQDAIYDFLADLSAPDSNNWRMSEKYGISKIRVAFLRCHWDKLYNEAYSSYRTLSQPVLYRKAS